MCNLSEGIAKVAYERGYKKVYRLEKYLPYPVV